MGFYDDLADEYKRGWLDASKALRERGLREASEIVVDLVNQGEEENEEASFRRIKTPQESKFPFKVGQDDITF